MKEVNIKEFFDSHKQNISDEGFSERLFATLDCLPAPVPEKKDKSRVIIALFALFGFLIFVMFGGYSALIDGLASSGIIFSSPKSASPEIIVSFILAMLSVYVVSKTVVQLK